MAEGEEAELLLVAAHGFEVANADGFVELRIELRSAGVSGGAHGFSLASCARVRVVPGWWFKSKPKYFTCQVFVLGHAAKEHRSPDFTAHSPARITHPAHTYRHKMLAQNTVEKGTKKPGGTNTSHHRALPFNS